MLHPPYFKRLYNKHLGSTDAKTRRRCPYWTPLSPNRLPTDLTTPLQPPHTSINQLGTPLPTKVPSSSVEVPFLLPTSVLAVSWAHFGFPEQQATSQTRPVNSQGAPLSGVVPALCCSACGGCLWWIPTQKDAKTQFLAPWHPTVAATNNLMTVLYFSSEMSGLWPGPRSQKIR